MGIHYNSMKEAIAQLNRMNWINCGNYWISADATCIAKIVQISRNCVMICANEI